MVDCQYKGVHLVAPPAAYRVGWICTKGHVGIINYCELCYKLMMDVYKGQGWLMGCTYSSDGEDCCGLQAGQLETIRV